jgi:hypothetical protein
MPNNFDEGYRRFTEKMRARAFKEAAKIKSDYNLPNDLLQVVVKEA